MIFAATALQIKQRIAITGMASHTGISGSARFPSTKNVAIGARKNICMRYIPKESFESCVIHLGAAAWRMHVNIRNIPKVAQSTLGVQNSHAHSSIGVSISCPGTPLSQKLHAVKAAPATKHIEPIVIRFLTDQSRWNLI